MQKNDSKKMPTLLVRRVFEALPPKWQAVLEYHLRRRTRNSWGGPFNGQAGRREIYVALLKQLQVAAIVETGTYRGTTTRYLAECSGVRVYTVEANQRLFHYAKLALKPYQKNIEMFLSDSVHFLQQVAERSGVPRTNVFFYLDAHWREALPLRDELSSIKKHWIDSVIMIDDFQVPDDPGYTYDDYGSGKCLCVDYLRPLDDLGFAIFFPTLSSMEETGRKRGCAVLADHSVAEKVEQTGLLRRYREA